MLIFIHCCLHLHSHLFFCLQFFLKLLPFFLIFFLDLNFFCSLSFIFLIELISLIIIYVLKFFLLFLLILLFFHSLIYYFLKNIILDLLHNEIFLVLNLFYLFVNLTCFVTWLIKKKILLIFSFFQFFLNFLKSRLKVLIILINHFFESWLWIVIFNLT